MDGNKKNWKRHLLIYMILLTAIGWGFFLRMLLVSYSLPVAAQVDERKGMRVLYRFNNGSLNPEYFSKPTFYYYLTYFLTRPLIKDFEDIVLYGRVINLLLGCFLIVGVFWFAKYVLNSEETGLVAAFFVASSPILIMNGSYIISDILLALTSLLSLLFFSAFFNRAQYRYWFAGVLMAGLAISSKYISAVPVVLAYLIYEFFFNNSNNSFENSNNFGERRFSLWWISGAVLAVAMICLVGYFFFPSYALIATLIQQQGNFNSSLDPGDIAFLESIKLKFLVLSVLSGIAFLLSLRFRTFLSRFCFLRPYIGLILIAFFFVLASPFLLISWQRALYDLVIVLKTNAIGSGERQWLSFAGHYLTKESVIGLAFLPVGVYWLIRHKKPWMMMTIYLVLSLIAYGSGNRVFYRYWTPVLPVMFVVSAYGLYATANLLGDAKWLRAGFLLLVLVCIGLELHPKHSSFVVANRMETNSAYGAFHWVLDNEPKTIYYSPRSYVPSFELEVMGFDLRGVPDLWIEDDDFSLLQRMGPDDVLMVDRRLKSQMSDTLRQHLSLEWGLDRDVGQYIYRKK